MAQFMYLVSFKEEVLPIKGLKAGGETIGDRMQTTGETGSRSSSQWATSVGIWLTRVSFSSAFSVSFR